MKVAEETESKTVAKEDANIPVNEIKNTGGGEDKKPLPDKPKGKKIEGKSRQGSETDSEVKKKHAGGRPNTRGKFKMVNIALPEDVYYRVKEVCNGNMTYYLNKVIKESVGM